MEKMTMKFVRGGHNPLLMTTDAGSEFLSSKGLGLGLDCTKIFEQNLEEKEIPIKKGDVLIGLPSTGLHTNGYSLALAVLLERYKLDMYFEELKKTLGETLLTVHRSYFRARR